MTIRICPDNPLLVENEHEGKKVYYYWCESCGGHDCFDDTRKVTSWNPLTLVQPVRMTMGGHGSKMPVKTICHVFIKNGIIEYLSDCANQKVAGSKRPMLPPKTEYFQGLT